MKNRINIVDTYFEQMANKCLCKSSDELLGTRYSISESVGEGTVSRRIIGEGLEIAHWDSSSIMEWSYNNEKHNSNIIEISYCYNGSVEIETFPNNKKYTIEKGDLSFYRMANSVDHFQFHQKDFVAISMHIDLDAMNNAVNPVWEKRVITKWKEIVGGIFSDDIFNIEKAPYNIKVIAQEIKNITIEDMMDYMKIKCKAIELFRLCLQHKLNKNDNPSNLSKDACDIIYKAETILLEDLQDPPSIKNLAKQLNTSVYKLQKGFKEIMGSTVYGHIRSIRVERSKILLKTTDMSIVFQDVFMLHDTILENIKMGSSASMEDIVSAAKRAQIHDFIMGLPDGYGTKLGESGIKLSGGEKQRISIARAILKDTPIVLLDEVTSYSDIENESKIQEALKNLLKEKTAIIIAHRLYTIKNSDNIIVLDEGEIVEQGTHEKLLLNDALYRHLWDMYEYEDNKALTIKAGVQYV